MNAAEQPKPNIIQDLAISIRVLQEELRLINPNDYWLDKVHVDRFGIHAIKDVYKQFAGITPFDALRGYENYIKNPL